VHDGRADTDDQLTAVRIDDVQPAPPVGVHVDAAIADAELPGLGVVDRRRERGRTHAACQLRPLWTRPGHHVDHRAASVSAGMRLNAVSSSRALWRFRISYRP